MSAPPVKKVRKSVRIDPEVLRRAREILGTDTDAETIEQALDLVSFKREAVGGVVQGAGARLWVDVLGDGVGDARTGHGILALAGSIPPEELRQMEEAIEEGCERIDESGWEPPKF